jgi:hypothetical protein
MYLNAWTQQNERRFGSAFESMFAKAVLPLVPEIRLEAITVQYPFLDSDGKQRYCDFVIEEDDVVRIAIEIDGFDKTGAGQGMSHDEFVDWQRRQASLASQGWFVLRFANRDVRDEPERCAAQISQLLRRLRGSKTRKLASLQATDPAQKRLTKASSHTAIKYAVPLGFAILMTVYFVAQKNSAPAEDALENDRSGLVSAGRAMDEQGEVGVGRDRIEEVMSDDEIAEGRAKQSVAQRIEAIDVVPKMEGYGRQSSRQYTGNRTANRGEVGIGSDRIEEMLSDEEVSSEIEAASRRTLRAVRRVAPGGENQGRSCSNPIAWIYASLHVGSVVAIDGPVVRVTRRENVRGSPTWIDLGASYPSERRFAAVVWGENLSRFPVPFASLEGKNVCVLGKISLYKGTPQVELRTAGQLKLMP